MAILSKIDMMYCSLLYTRTAARPPDVRVSLSSSSLPVSGPQFSRFSPPPSLPPPSISLSRFPAIEAKIRTDQLRRGEKEESGRASEWEKRILYPEKIKNAMRDEDGERGTALHSRFPSLFFPACGSTDAGEDQSGSFSVLLSSLGDNL